MKDSSKKLPQHRQKLDERKKVSFQLADAYERDLIISYSSNLKGDSKLDIVIPDNLLSLKSQLEAIAYRLRRHATKSDGKKLTTSLRLDDKTECLKLAVREKKEDRWLYYSLKELKQLESSIVGGGEDEEEEDN